MGLSLSAPPRRAVQRSPGCKGEAPSGIERITAEGGITPETRIPRRFQRAMVPRFGGAVISARKWLRFRALRRSGVVWRPAGPATVRVFSRTAALPGIAADAANKKKIRAFFGAC